MESRKSISQFCSENKFLSSIFRILLNLLLRFSYPKMIFNRCFKPVCERHHASISFKTNLKQRIFCRKSDHPLVRTSLNSTHFMGRSEIGQLNYFEMSQYFGISDVKFLPSVLHNVPRYNLQLCP